MDSTSIAASAASINPPAPTSVSVFDDSERVRVSFTVNQLQIMRDTLLSWRMLDEGEEDFLYDPNDAADRAQIEADRTYQRQVDNLIVDLEDILGM